jgi:hypothetical protein
MLNIIAGVFSEPTPPAPLTSYESIQTVTVGSGGSASIDFTSIPSTFKHLQIRCLSRSTVAGATPDNIAFRFNADSGSNYSTHNLFALGSGIIGEAAAFTGLNFGYVPSVSAAAGSLADTFSGVIIDILDYANTSKNKTVRALGGYDANSSGPNRIQLSSAFWNSTTAINSIAFTNSANYAQYTQFALYGIKG